MKYSMFEFDEEPGDFIDDWGTVCEHLNALRTQTKRQRWRTKI